MRCYDCGREPNGQGVAIRQTDDAVGFAGLVSCGRIWLCPVCNAKVMARRAVEIGAVLVWAESQGFHVIWGSLTCQHDRSSDLSALLEIQREAWRHVVQSRTWSKQNNATAMVAHSHDETCDHDCNRKKDTVLLSTPGRVGYIRASEITVSQAHGWHPHFHPLIFFRGTKRAAQAFAGEVVALWVDGVKSAGGFAQHHGAQQLRVITNAYEALSGYVTKSTYDAARLPLELVWSQGKTARRGRVAKTVPHWTLLAEVDLDLVDGGRGAGLEAPHLWSELEEATHLHRMIAWSRGLRTFAGLGDERTDEEIAEEEIGTADDTVALITPDGWRTIRDLPAVLALLLATLEVSGAPALRSLLDAHGVEYLTDWSFRPQRESV